MVPSQCSEWETGTKQGILSESLVWGELCSYSKLLYQKLFQSKTWFLLFLRSLGNYTEPHFSFVEDEIINFLFLLFKNEIDGKCYHIMVDKEITEW